MEIIIEDLEVAIRNFISSTSFADITKLKTDTLIFREGYFDSMGFMSLITFLEKDLHISVQDNDLIEDNFESINAIVNFISKKKSVA